MTFGRWILVHSLSIGILIMLGIGYFYKEELKLEEAYSQLLLIDSTSMPVSSNDKSQDVDTVAEKPIQNQHKQSSLNISVKEEKSTLSALPKSSSITIKQQKVLATEIAPKIDYLLEARKAYWDKNYEYAIQLYKNEIDKKPDSADLYGELGNIYYGLNNYELASVNYLNAGGLFLKMDDQFRAKQIYDILISIAPKKAQLLLNLKNEQHQ